MVADVLSPPKAKDEKVELCTDAITLIRAHLLSIACSPTWVEDIIDIMRGIDAARVAGDKPLLRRLPPLRFHVDRRGRLKTKIPDLLVMLEESGVYPPAADDRPGNDGCHPGSQMQPCLSEKCTQYHACGDGTYEPRSILYPRAYLSGGCLCEACRVNDTRLDELAAELGFTRSALMSPSSQGIRAAEYHGKKLKWRRTKQAKFPRLK